MKMTDEAVAQEALVAVRPLIAAEKLRRKRGLQAPGRGPMILLQARWLGSLYPPMTSELKAEAGIVEISDQELNLLADISPKVKQPVVQFLIPDAVERVENVLGAERLEQIRQARFVLVQYKLPSNVDYDYQPEDANDSAEFPQRPWRGLMLLHKGLQSDILMIDYSKSVVSEAMGKAHKAFYGKRLLEGVLLNDPWSLLPYRPYQLNIPDEKTGTPSMFFISAGERSRFSPFDTHDVKAMYDRTPERFVKDPILFQALGDKTLTLFKDFMAKETQNNGARLAEAYLFAGDKRREAHDMMVGVFKKMAAVGTRDEIAAMDPFVFGEKAVGARAVDLPFLYGIFLSPILAIDQNRFNNLRAKADDPASNVGKDPLIETVRDRKILGPGIYYDPTSLDTNVWGTIYKRAVTWRETITHSAMIHEALELATLDYGFTDPRLPAKGFTHRHLLVLEGELLAAHALGEVEFKSALQRLDHARKSLEELLGSAKAEDNPSEESLYRELTEGVSALIRHAGTPEFVQTAQSLAEEGFALHGNADSSSASLTQNDSAQPEIQNDGARSEGSRLAKNGHEDLREFLVRNSPAMIESKTGRSASELALARMTGRILLSRGDFRVAVEKRVDAPDAFKSDTQAVSKRKTKTLEQIENEYRKLLNDPAFDLGLFVHQLTLDRMPGLITSSITQQAAEQVRQNTAKISKTLYEILASHFARDSAVLMTQLRGKIIPLLRQAGFEANDLYDRRSKLKEYMESEGLDFAKAAYISEALNVEVFIPNGYVFLFSAMMGSARPVVAWGKVLKNQIAELRSPAFHRVLRVPKFVVDVIDGPPQLGAFYIPSRILIFEQGIRRHVSNLRFYQSTVDTLLRQAGAFGYSPGRQGLVDLARAANNGAAQTAELLAFYDQVMPLFDPAHKVRLAELIENDSFNHELAHWLMIIATGMPVNILDAVENRNASIINLSDQRSDEAISGVDWMIGALLDAEGALWAKYQALTDPVEKSVLLHQANETYADLTRFIESPIPFNTVYNSFQSAVHAELGLDEESTRGSAGYDLSDVFVLDAFAKLLRERKGIAAADRLRAYQFLHESTLEAQEWAKEIRAREFKTFEDLKIEIKPGPLSTAVVDPEPTPARLAAEAPQKLDPAKLQINERHFLNAVEYFNRNVLAAVWRDIPELRPEQVLELFERIRGDEENWEYLHSGDRNLRLDLIRGLMGFEGTLALVNTKLENPRDRGAVRAHLKKIHEAWVMSQPFEGAPGFTNFLPKQSSAFDSPHPASGHNRLGLFIRNFFLARNGYQPNSFDRSVDAERNIKLIRIERRGGRLAVGVLGAYHDIYSDDMERLNEFFKTASAAGWWGRDPKADITVWRVFSTDDGKFKFVNEKTDESAGLTGSVEKYEVWVPLLSGGSQRVSDLILFIEGQFPVLTGLSQWAEFKHGYVARSFENGSEGKKIIRSIRNYGLSAMIEKLKDPSLDSETRIYLILSIDYVMYGDTITNLFAGLNALYEMIADEDPAAREDRDFDSSRGHLRNILDLIQIYGRNSTTSKGYQNETVGEAVDAALKSFLAIQQEFTKLKEIPAIASEAPFRQKIRGWVKGATLPDRTNYDDEFFAHLAEAETILKDHIERLRSIQPENKVDSASRLAGSVLGADTKTGFGQSGLTDHGAQEPTGKFGVMNIDRDQAANVVDGALPLLMRTDLALQLESARLQGLDNLALGEGESTQWDKWLIAGERPVLGRLENWFALDSEAGQIASADRPGNNRVAHETGRVWEKDPEYFGDPNFAGSLSGTLPFFGESLQGNFRTQPSPTQDSARHSDSPQAGRNSEARSDIFSLGIHSHSRNIPYFERQNQIVPLPAARLAEGYESASRALVSDQNYLDRVDALQQLTFIEESSPANPRFWQERRERIAAGDADPALAALSDPVSDIRLLSTANIPGYPDYPVSRLIEYLKMPEAPSQSEGDPRMPEGIEYNRGIALQNARFAALFALGLVVQRQGDQTFARWLSADIDAIFKAELEQIQDPVAFEDEIKKLYQPYQSAPGLALSPLALDQKLSILQIMALFVRWHRDLGNLLQEDPRREVPPTAEKVYLDVGKYVSQSIRDVSAEASSETRDELNRLIYGPPTPRPAARLAEQAGIQGQVRAREILARVLVLEDEGKRTDTLPALPAELNGLSLGRIGADNKIPLRVYPGYGYYWNPLSGKQNQGYEGVVIGVGQTSGLPYFSVQFTDAAGLGRPVVEKTFYITPYARELPHYKDRESTQKARLISEYPALEAVSHLVVLADDFDFQNQKQELPNLKDLPLGPTNGQAFYSFDPLPWFPYAWRAPGVREGVFDGVVRESGVIGNLFFFRVAFTREKEVIEKTFYIGPYQRVLPGVGIMKSKKESVRLITESPGLEAIKLALTDSSGKIRTTDVREHVLGRTDSKGRFSFAVDENYPYEWPALGFYGAGYVARIAAADFTGSYPKFLIQFSRPDQPGVIHRAFQIGPYQISVKHRSQDQFKPFPAIIPVRADEAADETSQTAWSRPTDVNREDSSRDAAQNEFYTVLYGFIGSLTAAHQNIALSILSGQDDPRIAKESGLPATDVAQIRAGLQKAVGRFLDDGGARLAEQARTKERRDRVEAKLKDNPPQGGLWTTSLLAQELGLERETVYSDLQARELLESDRLEIDKRNSLTMDEIEQRRERVESKLYENPPHGGLWTVKLLAQELGILHRTVYGDLELLGLLESDRLEIGERNRPTADELRQRRDRVEFKLYEAPPQGNRWTAPLLGQKLHLARQTVYQDLKARGLLESDRLEIEERQRLTADELRQRRDRVESKLNEDPPQGDRWTIPLLAQELDLARQAVYKDLKARDLLGSTRLLFFKQGRLKEISRSAARYEEGADVFGDPSDQAALLEKIQGRLNEDEAQFLILDLSSEDSIEETAQRSGFTIEALIAQREVILSKLTSTPPPAARLADKEQVENEGRRLTADDSRVVLSLAQGVAGVGVWRDGDRYALKLSSLDALVTPKVLEDRSLQVQAMDRNGTEIGRWTMSADEFSAGRRESGSRARSGQAARDPELAQKVSRYLAVRGRDGAEAAQGKAVQSGVAVQVSFPEAILKAVAQGREEALREAVKLYLIDAAEFLAERHSGSIRFEHPSAEMTPVVNAVIAELRIYYANARDSKNLAKLAALQTNWETPLASDEKPVALRIKATREAKDASGIHLWVGLNRSEETAGEGFEAVPFLALLRFGRDTAASGFAPQNQELSDGLVSRWGALSGRAMDLQARANLSRALEGNLVDDDLAAQPLFKINWKDLLFFTAPILRSISSSA